jgi:cullin-4
LVIKNLKATSRQGLDEYYIKTWNELDDALTSVFNREQPKAPLELLCRGVEATCRHGRAEKLSRHLTERCKEFLEKKLLPVIEKTASAYNVDALRSVLLYWELWNRQSVSRLSYFRELD